ncbi:MAG: ATP-binding protein [Candidatus Thorarchaeota archaeon]|jgi:PAS domain S-box-containing protein
MGLGDGISWRSMSRQAIVSLLLLIMASIQTIVYYSIYQPRSTPDYDDVVIMSTISGIIFLLILMFQRSIEKRSARIPLQLGWAVFFYAGVHSALINSVDLLYPYNENLFSMLTQFYHDNLSLFLAVGVAISVIGIYSWVVETAARERRFHSLVAAMPVGVAMLDVEGRVTTYNHGFSHILNLEGSQIQNALMSDLLMTNVQSILQEDNTSSDVPTEIDVTLECDDGSKKYLVVSLVSNRERDGRVISHIAVVSDVTMRRRTAEEREQQRRVIDLYASLLSHDIGNDLQAVLGYVESSLMLLKTDNAKATEMLVSAQAAALRMTNLIKTFKSDVTPSHVEIVPMLKEVASQAERVSMGLKVQVHIESGAANLRSPGGTLLPIAMDNLLRNAAEHAGKDTIVDIRVLVEDSSLVIAVSDNGPGIPEEKLQSLFLRGDPDGESGLGLYLTKQIVTACGGIIALEDQDNGAGASFRITLPLAE